MQNGIEIKDINSWESPLRQVQFVGMPDHVLGKIFGFFSPEERKEYKGISRKIDPIIMGKFVWEGSLRGRPEGDQTSNEIIFKTKPCYRLPEYWPYYTESKAITFYNEVLKIYPNDPDARSGKSFWEVMATPAPANIADAKQEDKRRTEKAQIFLEILENHPQNANCFYYLGRLSQENHIKLDASDFPTQFTMQIEFTNRQGYKAAVLYFYALYFNPHHPQANYFLGELVESNFKGHYYRSVLRKDPGNVQDELFADARCRLANLIFTGQITAVKRDFYGREMPTTFLEQCKALYQPVLDANPNHPKALELKQALAKEERQKKELFQVAAKNWSEFIRRRFISKFEQLTRQQQLLILAGVEQAENIEIKKLQDDPRVKRAVDLNQASVMIINLAIIGLGFYGAYSISNKSDLIAASLGYKGYTGIYATEIIFAVVAFLCGICAFHYSQTPTERIIRLARREEMAPKVEKIIDNNSAVFFGERNREESYYTFSRLEKIPNRRWPRGVKRAVIDGFSGLSQSKQEAINDASSWKSGVNFEGHPKILLVKNLTNAFLYLIPILVFGASSYGMYKTVQLCPPGLIAVEILPALIISIYLCMWYSELKGKLVEYTEKSIREDATVSEVNAVMAGN